MSAGRTRIVTVPIVVWMLILATPAGVAMTAEHVSATSERGPESISDADIGTAIQETNNTTESPTADFVVSPDPPLAGAPVTFNASTSTDPDGEIVSYTWKINGTIVDQNQSFTLVFDGPKEITTRLTVQDDDNATASVTKIIEIRNEGSLDSPDFQNPERIEAEPAPEFEPVEKSHRQVIEFHSGPVELEPGLDPAVLDTARDRVWVVIQFNERPAWDDLHDLGVNRQDVLAYRTYYAGIPIETVETVANRSSVRAITAVQADWKRSPGLNEQSVTNTDRPVTVLTFENVDSLGFGLERIDTRTYTGNLTPDEISELQYDPIVKWIQPSLDSQPTLVAANRLSGSRFVKSQMRNVGGIAPGEDVRVAVIDTGIDHDHPHFDTVSIVDSYDRPQGDWYPEADNFDWGGNGHGTHVAGIVAGKSEDYDSTRDEWVLYEGIAPNATLVISRGFNVRNHASVNKNDSDIITNSWGGGSGGRYNWDARWLDQWARNHTNVTVLFAYGNYNKSNPNEQWANSPGLAKNIITVGSLNDGTGKINDPTEFKNNIDTVNNIAWLNNRSQPRDGQIKPDVNAPGHSITSAVPNGTLAAKSGSSMATPHVAGIAALLESSIKGKLPASKTGYSSAETKAIIVGTAGPVENPKPSERPEGYGGANAHNAVFHNRYESVNRLYGGSLTGLSNTKKHTFSVPKDAKKVIVSLAWLDLPGSTSTKDTLVNDLDLYVGPSSNPKQYSVTDRNNTVNRLVIQPAELDKGKQWTVTVNGHALLFSTPWNTTEPQPYAGQIRVVNEEPKLSVQVPDEIIVHPGGRYTYEEETIDIAIQGDGSPVTGVRGVIDTDSEVEKCGRDAGPRAFVVGMLSEGLSHHEQICVRIPEEVGKYNVTIRVNSTNAVRGDITKNVTFVVPKPRVTLEPYTQATHVGGNVTYRLVAKNITDGVSYFNVNVSLREPKIGAFTKVEEYVYSEYFDRYEYGPKNDTVSIEAKGRRIHEDHGPKLHLANITVRGDRIGSSLIDVEVLGLRERTTAGGDPYPLRKQSGPEFTAPPDGELIVDSGPPIAVSPDSIQVFEQVHFEGPDPGVFEPAHIEWEFDDGSTASDNRSVNHTYFAAGQYNVTLRYIDRYGAIQPHRTTVTVNLPSYLENLGDSVLVDEANLKTTYLLGRIRVDQPLGLTIEETENTSDSYSLDFSAPQGTKNLTFHVRTDEIKPLNDPENTTMLVDRRPSPYYLSRDAAGDLWAAGNIDNFSTRTVTFTTDEPPTINAGPDIETTEGATETQTVSITDPDSTELTLTIDYGNGTSITRTVSPGNVDLSLRYADNGTYSVEVTVKDAHSIVSDTARVSVENVDPTVSVMATDIDEGNATTVMGSFSDPGTADTHTAVVDWGDGTSETVPVDQDNNSLMVTHEYGDNGDYDVAVTVTDDDGGSGTTSTSVNVANLAPSATLNTSTGITFPSDDSAFIGQVDTAQSHEVRATDNGSDDLTVTWEASNSQTYYNDGNTPDPDQSPGGIYPYTIIDETSVEFESPGVQYVVVTVADDDGAQTTESHPKIVTSDAVKTRGLGYWQHEYSGHGKSDYSPTNLEAFLNASMFASGVFSEATTVNTINAAHDALSPKGPGMRAKAEAHALAAWLNFAAGGVGWSEPVDVDNDGEPDRSFASVIKEIESILTDSKSTHSELERAKNLAEAINS